MTVLAQDAIEDQYKNSLDPMMALGNANIEIVRLYKRNCLMGGFAIDVIGERYTPHSNRRVS